MDAIALLTDLNAIERLRNGDPTLFDTTDDGQALAAQSLGWTDLASGAQAMPEIRKRTIAELGDSVTDVIVLGMGGSSLATLVMGHVLAASARRRLHVLDTTSPVTVSATLEALDLATSLFLVSSKSGGTIEPMSLYTIFRAAADEQLGREAAGERFIAVTDPGTSLETLAVAEGFHAVIHGVSTVGGRFSALTAFGLAPAALLGFDVDELVARAAEEETACALAIAFNPAAKLAAFIADSATAGRDKLTIVASPELSTFGLWVEQLVAESLGKEGRGIVPVVELADDLPVGYGPDRAIVVLRYADDERLAEWLPKLGEMGPVYGMTLEAPEDVAAEFVLWEHAVALLGVLTGVNPFGQPNVAAAKAATNAVLAGELAAPAADSTTPDGVALTFAGGLAAPDHEECSTSMAIGHAFSTLAEGDYVGVLAYLPDDTGLLAPLTAAVPPVAAQLGAAVTLELGPRYLHSTGQLHKGGPNTGVFVLVTTRDHTDLPVPGRDWTLRDLHIAQAEGDLTTLVSAGRRVVRLDLPDASAASVAALAAALEDAAGVVREG